MLFLIYFQERMPHITQAHEKIKILLQYLDVNSNLEQDHEFCFEEEFDSNSKDKEEMTTLFNSIPLV